jgi:2-phospho-L-lactate/phosphoenolpyruvate guanylyltransferase
VLGEELRSALAVSFAVDTVAAALECPAVACVVVVTDDHELAGQLGALGAWAVPDGAGGDLNESLAQAAAELHRRRPELGIAALCGDLPALRPDHLTRALSSAGGEGMSFLTDAAGVGTTLLVAPAVEQFLPRFGIGSRLRHLQAGATELVLDDVATLRRDVDTPDDLAEAVRLGVRSHTAAVARGIGPRLADMQATVFAFDPDSCSGSVVLDDGLELPFAAESVDSSLRLLRPGQRVRLETAGAGGLLRVVRLQHATLP